MAVLFLIFAVVQYNDPDPVRWIAIYALAAVVCVLAAYRRVTYLLPLVVAAISLSWASLLIPEIYGNVEPAELFQTVKMKTVAVELGRETGGLFIAGIWMLVSAMVLFHRRR